MLPADTSAAALRKGVAISTCGALALGSGVVFVRYAYQAGVLPGMAIFLRFSLAAVVLGLFLWFTGRQMRLARERAVAIFLLGFVGFSLMGITFFVALSLIPAWLVALMTALYPLLTNLASWLFLKERLTRWQWLALAAVIIGGALLFIRPLEQVVWAGVMLMLLNAGVVAVYLLVGQHWTRGVPPLISAAWTIIGAAAGTFLYALVVGEISINFAAVGWLWAFCFAVISTAFAIMAQWWGVSLIGASRVSIIGAFEPLSAVLLAMLVLGEQLTWPQLAGGLFILAGMVLVQQRR